jgi:hypothetical protein
LRAYLSQQGSSRCPACWIATAVGTMRKESPVECRCSVSLPLNKHLQKFETDIVEMAVRVYKSAGDPISGVVKFLQERPENTSLSGYIISRVLLETFGSREQIPELVELLSGHCHEIIRQRNVINIIKEHPVLERWGNYLIKQKERVKFEICLDRDKVLLKNIAGLIFVEHGIDIPLDRIRINPPKLEVTLRIGLLRHQKVVDIA